MNIEMHGKKIASICWPDTDVAEGASLIAGESVGELHLSATSQGCNGEFWVVRTKAGKEVSRYNTAFLQGINWA